MAGSRRRGAIRRELMRESGRARRLLVAPVRVLTAFAGFGPVALAPNPRLSPMVNGFLALPTGLLVSGLADLILAGGSPQARARLRLISLALVTVGLFALLLAPVFD